MIKDILQQLAPLDEKIAALRGDPADENMPDITHPAAELAELSAQEDALLSGSGAPPRCSGWYSPRSAWPQAAPHPAAAPASRRLRVWQWISW